MFGNILNKGQIQLLVTEGKLRISNFSLGKFRQAHYPLTAFQAAKVGDLDAQGRRRPSTPHEFRHNPELTFEPFEYRLVEVEEYVELPNGISGHFVPSYSLVTNGFGLHAGKIDPGYGKLQDQTQRLVFGVQNLLDRPNTFSCNSGFVYMYLLDFRALGKGGVDFTDQQIRRIQMISELFNHADDDGVQYDR